MSGKDIAEANRQGGAQALAKSARTAATDDRPFAILRYAKLNSMAAIRGSSKHMRRTIRTPNADPSLTNSNEIFAGSPDPTADVLARLPELGARNADGHLLRRKNSVLCVEVLMTISPEWWRDASQADADAWIEQSQAWLEAEWGAENVVHLELHRDETTPHLTGLIVPLDPETGGLNARRWIGGRSSRAEPGTSRLSGHQTRYAEAVENLGLRRGRIGSTATHIELREYQRRAATVLRDEVKPPQLGTPPLVGREKWAEEAQAKVDAAVAAQAVGAAEARAERGKARAAESLADRRQAALDAARAERKALTDRLREIPVERVVEDLGGIFDPKEKRWKLGPDGARTHKIEITDQRWRCAILQAGGRGAIDLVKAVHETDFEGALSWLSDRYGPGETIADLTARTERQARARVERAVDERPPFTPPAPDAAAWPAVRSYLVDVRGIEAELIDAAHEAGDVYAQTRQGPKGGQLVNAIFLQRGPDGVPTGAEIKGLHKRRDGTRFSGLAAGSRKDRGAFRAGAALAAARVVVVVESAIDAMSAFMFARSKGRDAGVCVISTAGEMKKGATLPEPVFSAIPATAKRLAGQDRNYAGKRQFHHLRQVDKEHEWKRWTPPPPHEDWNDWAQAYAAEQRRGGDSDQSQPDDPFAPDPDDPGPQPD